MPDQTLDERLQAALQRSRQMRSQSNVLLKHMYEVLADADAARRRALEFLDQHSQKPPTVKT